MQNQTINQLYNSTLRCRHINSLAWQYGFVNFFKRKRTHEMNKWRWDAQFKEPDNKQNGDFQLSP
jgi:hypothetical protein